MGVGADESGCNQSIGTVEALRRLEQPVNSGALSDPLAALIFAGYNHGSEYTIVNGRIAVENGVLTGFSEEELMWKCNQISKKWLEG